MERSVQCFIFLCLFAVWTSSTQAKLPNANKFYVQSNDEHHGYDVFMNGLTWLKSAPIRVHTNDKWYSTADESLKLVATDKDVGRDKHGPWVQSAYEFNLKDNKEAVFVALIRVYTESPLVLFGQHFPRGMENCSTGDAQGLVSAFPSFHKQDPTLWSSEKLGYLAYGGIMFGDTDKRVGQWKNDSSQRSGLDSGPLVLFNVHDDAIVLSPYNNFMDMSAVYEKSATGSIVSWGVMGKVDKIPLGYTSWTGLVYSHEGINMVMETFGFIMRHQYNKDTYFRDTDLANNYIGFWTDNGAYYYYLTEPGMDYKQTMIDVTTNAKVLDIPYRYLQYDSWFYPKEPNKGAVIQWTGLESVFPGGLQAVYNITQQPVVAHNRYWSKNTVYADENGGPYKFIVEQDTGFSIPVDQKFWDHLMRESKKWGLITYEQDWLNKEFDEMESTVSNIGLGRLWLTQMGRGAAKAGLTIQYCMAPSRAALQSLEIPVVTQGRVSTDYLLGPTQWKIGVSSIFAHALGVAPFKDNFWTTSIQPGNPFGKTEPYPELQSLVATLSTGPVGPSDMLGKSDRELIMRSCNSDGLIIKPSRPAMAINHQLQKAVFGSFSGEAWSTYSDISGFRFGILFGASFGSGDSMQLTPSSAGLGHRLMNSKVFSRTSPLFMHDFSEDTPITMKNCTNKDFCLLYTTPILAFRGAELLLVGELDKWVPMSAKRVSDINISAHFVEISLKGGVGETVHFTVLYAKSAIQFKCVMSESGTASAMITEHESFCT